MNAFDQSDQSGQSVHWEQRWHPLRRQWVVIAAHRDDRPWSGQEMANDAPQQQGYDPDCYLCPGNTRIGGARNPDYDGVFVFDNDHPCVSPAAPSQTSDATTPYVSSPASGIARVVCYHPRHDLRLAQLPVERIVKLFTTWQDQYRELAARPEVRHVLVFENNGQAVGVSNPHPHCQIYATNFVFPTIEQEVTACAAHHQQHGDSLLGRMIASECEDGRRVLDDTTHAISFVPYCARYAYETFVSPHRPVGSIADLDEAELLDLAHVLKCTVTRLDNLWRMPMPYVMALHQAPTHEAMPPGFHFHIELHPPLRKPHLLKFLAGPEVGAGGFIADSWPEEKAAELRAVSGQRHYLDEAPSQTSNEVTHG